MIPVAAARAARPGSRPGPGHDARSGPVPSLRVGLAATIALLLAACSGGASLSPDDGAGGAGGGGAVSGGSAGGSGAGAGLDANLAEAPEGLPTGDVPSTLAASRLDPADVEASRMLMQATFGPTMDSIAEYRSFPDASSWIDAQMALPASLASPYTRANSNGSNPQARHEAWWNNALYGEDQLRQRVAFALSQLFVVSDVDFALANAQYGVADYYDMLAVSAFGNYRELLEDVALHPVMGVYLSMVLNEKADEATNVRPDENFAREVLQLFSIGLHELDASARPVPANDPAPAYTQRTVEEFARVFTGWNYPAARYWNDTNINVANFEGPMEPDEVYHDVGAKKLLNGAIAPAGLTAREDLEFALDNIAIHPNVGPFVSKRLIQRLVTSNPSPAYVARASATFDDDGAGERGNLGALVRAILLDPEARTGHVDDPDFGKLREPVVRMVHLWRALDAVPGPEANGVHRTADFALYRIDEAVGQAVQHASSVFDFYPPDNATVPGGERLSPEMQIMSEADIAATHDDLRHQFHRSTTRSDLSDDSPRMTLADLEPLVALARDPGALLDRYDLLFAAGGMPDDVRAVLGDYLGRFGDDDRSRYAAVQDTMFMLSVSPTFTLQR